jgi:hypothetical protein
VKFDSADAKRFREARGQNGPRKRSEIRNWHPETAPIAETAMGPMAAKFLRQY